MSEILKWMADNHWMILRKSDTWIEAMSPTGSAWTFTFADLAGDNVNRSLSAYKCHSIDVDVSGNIRNEVWER